MKPEIIKKEQMAAITYLGELFLFYALQSADSALLWRYHEEEADSDHG